MRTLLFISSLLVSCATLYPGTSLNLISESEYKSIVDAHSSQKQVYDGLMNVLEIHATLLSSKLSHAQIDQNARIYQWNQTQYQQEKSQLETKLISEAQVFVSFFVPEKKYNDLNKSDTKWKIFLDVAGRRFEGKAKKMKAELAEVVSLYPDHTRWGTPYLISFPTATSLVDNNFAKMTFTGPAGSVTIDFLTR